MRVDIGQRIFERYDFAACSGCPGLVDERFRPSKIAVCRLHQLGDRDRYSVIDRGKFPGRNLLFKPLLLGGTKRDRHIKTIRDPYLDLNMRLRVSSLITPRRAPLPARRC